ncbi:MAG: cytochrome c [Nannocystaceae bacterium]
MRSLLFLALPALLALSGCDSDSGDGGGGDRNADIKALTGDAASGQTVFSSMTCASSGCHGADGNSGSAPALRDSAPGLSDDQIIDSVLDGKGAMPPNDLEDQEMADVLAWVRSTFG